MSHTLGDQSKSQKGLLNRYKFRWWHAVILILIVAGTGLLVWRFSRADTQPTEQQIYDQIKDCIYERCPGYEGSSVEQGGGGAPTQLRLRVNKNNLGLFTDTFIKWTGPDDFKDEVVLVDPNKRFVGKGDQRCVLVRKEEGRKKLYDFLDDEAHIYNTQIVIDWASVFTVLTGPVGVIEGSTQLFNNITKYYNDQSKVGIFDRATRIWLYGETFNCNGSPTTNFGSFPHSVFDAFKVPFTAIPNATTKSAIAKALGDNLGNFLFDRAYNFMVSGTTTNQSGGVPQYIDARNRIINRPSNFASTRPVGPTGPPPTEDPSPTAVFGNYEQQLVQIALLNSTAATRPGVVSGLKALCVFYRYADRIPCIGYIDEQASLQLYAQTVPPWNEAEKQNVINKFSAYDGVLTQYTIEYLKLLCPLYSNSSTCPAFVQQQYVELRCVNGLRRHAYLLCNEPSDNWQVAYSGDIFGNPNFKVTILKDKNGRCGETSTTDSRYLHLRDCNDLAQLLAYAEYLKQVEFGTKVANIQDVQPLKPSGYGGPANVPSTTTAEFSARTGNLRTQSAFEKPRGRTVVSTYPGYSIPIQNFIPDPKGFRSTRTNDLNAAPNFWGGIWGWIDGKFAAAGGVPGNYGAFLYGPFENPGGSVKTTVETGKGLKVCWNMKDIGRAENGNVRSKVRVQVTGGGGAYQSVDSQIELDSVWFKDYCVDNIEVNPNGNNLEYPVTLLSGVAAVSNITRTFYYLDKVYSIPTNPNQNSTYTTLKQEGNSRGQCIATQDQKACKLSTGRALTVTSKVFAAEASTKQKRLCVDAKKGASNTIKAAIYKNNPAINKSVLAANIELNKEPPRFKLDGSALPDLYCGNMRLEASQAFDNVVLTSTNPTNDPVEVSYVFIGRRDPKTGLWPASVIK